MPDTYAALQERLDARIARLRRRSTRFVRLRVALFLLILAGAGMPAPDAVRVGIAAGATAAFIAVAVVHRRIDGSIVRHRKWKEIKREQEARRRLDWDALPEPVGQEYGGEREFDGGQEYGGEREFDGGHPFASDVNLFGAASLHRLLDISVSHRGSALLASWLADPAPALDEIHARQRTVRGLVPLGHFREHMRLAYAMVARDRLDGDAFLSWLRRASLPASIRYVLPLTLVLAAVTLALFLLWGFGVVGPWFLVSFLIYGSVYFLNSGVRDAFLEAAIRLDEELGRLKTVFRFLERYPVGGRPALEELTAAFRDEEQSPSRHIRGILRNVVAAGLSMNPIMMILLNIPFPWDFWFAARLERRRRAVASLLPGWLDALHRLEALQSLANFAALHPAYIFPDIAGGDAGHGDASHPTAKEPKDTTSSPSDEAATGAAATGAAATGAAATGAAAVFEARELGHPLIPAADRVCNDFRVDREGMIFLVTGSNMSGKSTFLRTVGVNLVLAYAGGPVVASHFSARLFRLYTCIQISDSLREGVSYFYAEVRRLRGLLTRLDAAESVPMFFLIDEIFKGTNNIERHVGSEAYLTALAGRHGSGIVSTHDIELTALPERIGDMVNLHFREHIEDGEMRFDYRLRPGPCPTTNALVIMRMEGLPVAPPPAAP